MNLGQIRERIENELQTAPTTEAWVNDVYNKVNDAFQLLMVEERWQFKLVEYSLRLRADERNVALTINNSTGYPVDLRPVGPVRDVRYHDLDALVLVASDEADSLRRFGRIAGGVCWPPHWRQVSRLYNGRDLGGWADPDLTPTQDKDVFLEAPVAATYRTAYTDCILRHDRYQLPYDCAEVVSIMDRDAQRGELELIDRTRERMLMLNKDVEGAPEAYLLDESIDCGPAPYKTPTAVVTGGGAGTLAVGTYRYFYTFTGKGAISGPSGIVDVTTSSGAGSRVVLSGAQVESTSDSYWRTKLWWRADNDSGVFRYIGYSNASASSFTDNGGTEDESLLWDDRMAAPRKAIRVWPRPSEDRWVEVQYMRQPNRLRTAQDVPEMPEEYHPILVHMACEALCNRYEQAARMVSFHRTKAAEIRALMQTKEVARFTSEQLARFAPRRRSRWIPTNRATMNT